jgi:hypothetical protein
MPEVSAIKMSQLAIVLGISAWQVRRNYSLMPAGSAEWNARGYTPARAR